MKIDYVELQSNDFEKTKAFYIKAFGWTFTDWSEDYISFDNAGLEGGFARTDERPIQGAMVILRTDDIEAAEKTVVDAGGEIVNRIEFPGGKRFEFLDPTGNQLAVWTKA